jgi:tetratricopeptide (TPR) repeat protein
MRLLRHAELALSIVDYRPALRLCLYTLWPALGLYLVTQQPGWFALVALPLITAVHCRICLEAALPQLGRYRANLRQGKYPQASFHAVIALQKLEQRPSLNYLNVLRPRLAHPNLKDHLESELAALKLLQGEIPEAERRLRKIIDSGRAEPIAYHNLAVTLAERGQWHEARHFVRVARGLGVCPPYRVTRRKANRAKLSPRAQDQHLQWIWDVAGFYRKLGLHQLALACCEYTTHRALALAQVHSLLALGRIDRAEKLALKASQMEPNNSRNWVALSLVRLAQERYEEALDLVDKSIDMTPDWPLVRRLSYEIEIWLGNKKDLLDLLAWVKEHEPHRALRLTTEALIHYRLEHWHACLEKAEQVVGTSGETAVLGGIVGIALDKLGQSEKAVPLLRRFLAYTELKAYPMAHLERRRAAAQLVLDTDLCDV